MAKYIPEVHRRPATETWERWTAEEREERERERERERVPETKIEIEGAVDVYWGL
jgi:hypothetical protein